MHRDHELPQERYSKAEYKRLQRDALNALKDENAKAFLKEHLRHAMEISLKERMTALSDYSLGDESDLITDEVITQIVRARNNLTHSSTRKLKRLADSEDLYYLTQYVDWLLRSCFLVELGLATEDIAQMLEESDRFSWLRRATSAAADG